jgi:hypothetical protein
MNQSLLTQLGVAVSGNRSAAFSGQSNLSLLSIIVNCLSYR